MIFSVWRKEAGRIPAHREMGPDRPCQKKSCPIQSRKSTQMASLILEKKAVGKKEFSPTAL
jgi:hypothetical protein